MNNWLFLAPIGMIVVGLGFIFYWLRLHKTKFIIFAWGGLLWFIAISLKALMDGTVTQPLIEFINSLTPALMLLIVSVIIGLRTGFFESGISYLMLKGRVSKFKLSDSVGLGIGFGAFEAISLGLLTLISMSLLASPEFIASLSEEQKAIVEAQLNMSSLTIFAPWIERFFTIIAHIFATVLVIKSIQLKDKRFLWLSIGYKALLDTPVPYFQILIASDPLTMSYVVELYVIAIGVLGFYGLNWLKTKTAKS